MKRIIQKEENVHSMYVIYTLLFLILCIAIYSPFIINHKTFIWQVDGASQHYPTLVYYHRWLQSLFSGEGVKLFDLSLGMGFDTITTLHYYVLGDPFTFIEALFPEHMLITIYNISVIVRLYCAGLSFLIFVRSFHQNGMKIVLGALIYIFSGFLFFSAVRHPYFINPMIYLPLMILGCEKVFQKKRPTLLIWMTFITTISNFYFLYIISVILVIYCLVRYAITYSKEENKKLFGLLKAGVTIGGFYIIGILMACIVLLPVVYAFAHNGRMTVSPEMTNGMLIYDMKYYYRLLIGFLCSGMTPGYYTELCYATICVSSILLLFLRRKYSVLQIFFVLCIAGLCFPFVGSLMNGGSYVTNRWSFCLGFVIALIFVFTYDDLFHQTKLERILLGIGCAIYVYAVCKRGYGLSYYEAELLAVTGITVIGINYYNEKKRIVYPNVVEKCVIYFLVITSLALHGYAYYSENFHGYVKQFLTASEVREITTGGALELIGEIDDDSTYRIETYGDTARNEALCVKYNDVSGYFSLFDGSVTAYYKDLELLNQRNAYRIDNMDNRTILNGLLGVKYFVTERKAAAPYAYKLIKEKTVNDTTYYLFENLFALPLGIVYDTAISEETYNVLSSLEKQNVVLQSVVLGEEDKKMLPEVTEINTKNIHDLAYEMTAGDGLEIFKDKFVVKKAGATLTVNFISSPKAEVYLRFEKLIYDTEKSSMITLLVKAEKEATKFLNLRSKYHNTYFGKDDYLVNLGYNIEGITSATVTFPCKGTFYYDKFEVSELTMDYFKEQYNKHKETAAQNLVVKKNQISCDVTIDKEGMFVLSIPYSKGYTACVDGTKTSIVRANMAYMGILLPEGHHDIKLTYCTPELRLGALLSGLGFVLFGCVCFFLSKKESASDR